MKKKTSNLEREAIFLDFDGVIVESTKIKSEAFQELYAQHKNVLEYIMDYHAAHEGISRYEKIRYCHKEFLGISLSDEELETLTEKYSLLVKQAVIDCDVVPGALEFLRLYSSRAPFFLISGTPEEELRDIMLERALARYFVSIHGSPRKKAPTINELIGLHQLDKKRCLFVGDAMIDYLAAKATGIKFIGRVKQGNVSPFPNGTEIVSDLSQLNL
tara:strand:+ start:156 stop:803 length:648 start_codon:yes stop_codon:yes gene_type:complete